MTTYSESFRLDPLFLAKPKLLIKDLLSLEKVENVPVVECFKFHDHVIRFVDISGIIVGVEQKSTQVNYTVDDSTGTVVCCEWKEQLYTSQALPLGTSVRILGKLITFNNEKQVSMFDIFVIQDPNQELTHFLATLSVQEQYKKEFVLPTNTERSAPSTFAKQISVQNFAYEILEFLRTDISMGASCSINYIRQVPQLIEYAGNILLKDSDRIEEYRIHDQFIEALEILLSNGLIVKKSELYMLVDKNEIDLFVLNTIKQVSDKRKDVSCAGIHEDYIQLMIKQKYAFEKKWLIKVTQNALKDLYYKGLIYPTSDRAYRAT